MITDEGNPRMQEAQHELLTRLGAVLGDGTHPLTKPFLDRLFSEIRDHRASWRLKGVDFPVMVALCIPRFGVVEFVRADLDMPSIKQKMVNFIRQYMPPATMEEVVIAFRMAYPDLQLSDLIDQKQTADKAEARSLERAERIGKEADEIADGQFGGDSPRRDH